MKSLVDSVRERREPRWRDLDAVMERLGEAVGEGPTRRYRGAGGRPATPEWKLERIRELLADGRGRQSIADELHVGKATVARVAAQTGEGT